MPYVTNPKEKKLVQTCALFQINSYDITNPHREKILYCLLINIRNKIKQGKKKTAV